MSPAQAISAQLRATQPFPFEILASSALADGIIIAIVANAIAIAIDSTPRISASNEGLLVMDDAPAQVSTVGSPATVAAPARTLFQTDEIGLRLVWEIAFSLRTATGLAWISGITKW
jgi:hypothetical protein